MNSIMRRAKLGLLLGVAACLLQSLPAQTGPVLEARMYAGITLTGAVNTAYAIQATTNLADTNGWTTLANVVLTNSLWLFFDTNSPVMAKRFYRAVGMNTNTPPDTNAPSGMVLIPAGSFTMGDALGDGNELPTHTVYVSAFYMDRYEVTKALWDEVYQWAIGHGYSFDNAGLGKAANHPVHTVSWYDVVKWCNARSEKEGRVPAYYFRQAQTTAFIYRSGQAPIQNDWVNWNAGYRLPTEAEWEKAARGGASGHRFPWSDVDTITHSLANYRSDYLPSYDLSPTIGYHPSYDNDPQPYTSPVGSFAPNGYGLYDMAGNVSEFCWNWYEDYSSGTQADPRGPASVLSSDRMFRGGSWCFTAFYCRAAYRHNFWPGSGINYSGFRSALPPGQP